MATYVPVTVVPSGGAPFVQVSGNAPAMTVVPNAAPITLVTANAPGVALYNPDGSPYSAVYDPVVALGSDLIAYWEANRSDLITQSGGLVSSWKDVVAGYEAAQAGGSARPAYSATGFNGKPTLVYDGTDDVLIVAAHPFPVGATAHENWLLVRSDAVDNTTVRDPFVYGGGGFGSQVRHQRAINNNSQIGIGNGAGNVIITGSLPYTNNVPRVVRGVLDSSSRLDVDGSVGTPVSTTSTSIGSGQAAIGAVTNQTAYWLGAITAILVTKPLTQDKADALTAWLNARR